jgi:hypothetical protein
MYCSLRDPDLKVLPLVSLSFLSPLLLGFFIFLAFPLSLSFCVHLSSWVLSSSSLLDCFELDCIMAEFYSYFHSCDRNFVHRLIFDINLHPVLGSWN